MSSPPPPLDFTDSTFLPVAAPTDVPQIGGVTRAPKGEKQIFKRRAAGIGTSSSRTSVLNSQRDASLLGVTRRKPAGSVRCCRVQFPRATKINGRGFKWWWMKTKTQVKKRKGRAVFSLAYLRLHLHCSCTIPSFPPVSASLKFTHHRFPQLTASRPSSTPSRRFPLQPQGRSNEDRPSPLQLLAPPPSTLPSSRQVVTAFHEDPRQVDILHFYPISINCCLTRIVS